ncbi:PE-PPE domain-containing protein [Mycobacterium palustre]|uniref:PE-PPE domain-containing protein n=1 Tax=Mycobacterium palustre TaxID=153971 RepID=A0A1X1ZTY7_9MYCO|nr:PE-PPE domain-containing protein [Mycobacterium palustre]MCV7100960.1 PE-PPE domain-containing protein [Mycobacterium palustre]ORW27035.1 hypothetical protein AWC19_03155 [Mycobacterium palustre]
MTGWADLQANISGVTKLRHAALTYNGTWGAGLVQYPSDVVNGLNQFVDDGLCYEVPCPYPASFGPLGGPATAPSYQQSIQDAIDWTAAWLAENPQKTFAVLGYSQGAEAASRVYMELVAGSQYERNFVGGITFGNPCRMPGASAPGVTGLGSRWRGISPIRMTSLPTVNGQVVWADYAHNTANGDAGNDMYAQVPDTAVGAIMTDVYTIATQAQLNNPTAFLQAMVAGMLKLVEDSGLLSGLKGGAAGLLAMGAGAAVAFLVDLVGGVDINATGADAAVAAAVLGLQFLAAPGGPTGPHISYLGEIPGYSNLVADAVGFLHNIATITPARA